MSLKECKSCKKQISKDAEKCLNCGAPQNVFLNIIASFIILFLFLYFSGDITDAFVYIMSLKD